MQEQLIDIGDFHTIPHELVECVNQNNIILKDFICFPEIRDGQCYPRTLESSDFYNSSKLMQLLHNVKDISDNYYFLGHHVSRVANPEEIWRTGLSILEYDSYCSRLANLLRAYNIAEAEIVTAMSEISRLYNGWSGNRKERLCFFSPENELYQGGYDKFAINIGGEIAERTLEKYSNIWDVLTKHGTPILVSFRFKFEDLYDWQCNMFFANVIAKIAYQTLLNYNYRAQLGQHIKNPVLSENILAIKEISIRQYE